MAKRITAFIAAVLSSLIFFSCSAIQDKSSISVSVPKNAFRAADDSDGGEWSLKVSLSGGYTAEETFLIQEDSLSSTQTFTMDNLPSGQRVSVDVNVYYGSLLYYKTVETKQVTLEEGDNTVDISLKKAVGDGEIEVVDTIYITAIDEDNNQYTYSASSGEIPALPYKKKISFILGTEQFSNSWTYSWALNDNSLESTYASVSITLSDIKYIDYVNIDGQNSIVCFFGDATQQYSAEFKFTVDDSEASSE